MLLALSVACTGTGPEAVSSDDAQVEGRTEERDDHENTTTTTPPPTTTTVPPRDPVLGNGQQVHLAFAGDTYFNGPLSQLLATEPATMFSAVTPLVSAADVAVVNLEAALADVDTPVPDKEFVFRSATSGLDALGAAGFDVVSMANDHALDHGPEGLAATVAAQAAGRLPVIGIGPDEATAYAAHMVDVRGQTVAVVAATQVLDNSRAEAQTATTTQGGVASAERVDRLLQEVAHVRAQADTVVVFLHWGSLSDTCPTTEQRELAQQLVTAGADVIVGGGTHSLQGAGFMGSALVGYGLGNFAFNADTAAAGESGVLQVSVTGRRVDSVAWAPAEIDGDRLPIPLAEPEATEARTDWAELAACAELAPTAAPVAGPPTTVAPAPLPGDEDAPASVSVLPEEGWVIPFLPSGFAPAAGRPASATRRPTGGSGG